MSQAKIIHYEIIDIFQFFFIYTYTGSTESHEYTVDNFLFMDFEYTFHNLIQKK